MRSKVSEIIYNRSDTSSQQGGGMRVVMLNQFKSSVWRLTKDRSQVVRVPLPRKNWRAQLLYEGFTWDLSILIRFGGC